MAGYISTRLGSFIQSAAGTAILFASRLHNDLVPRLSRMIAIDTDVMWQMRLQCAFGLFLRCARLAWFHQSRLISTPISFIQCFSHDLFRFTDMAYVIIQITVDFTVGIRLRDVFAALTLMIRLYGFVFFVF
jgi:hypothetical protein